MPSTSHARQQQPEPGTTQEPAGTESADPAAVALATGPQPSQEETPETQGTGHQTASQRGFQQKGGPEIEATQEAMGNNMVNDMHNANLDPGSKGQYDLHHGIHYSYNYQAECEQEGQKQLWKDEYRWGYNESGMFQNPQETGGFMDFKLKKGQSASQGIKAWLKGLTIAECLTSVFAMEYDTLRAAVGDKKFDQTFGSANAQEDEAVEQSGNRLHIAPSGGTPISQYLEQTKAAELAGDGKHKDGVLSSQELDDTLIPGQWYYFYNHPKYLLKHPGGAWQGENSLYMGRNPQGKRVWAGLGATNKTEDEMVEEMVEAYAAPRDAEDERTLKERHLKNDDGTYTDKKYDPHSGEFKNSYTKSQILTDPSYTIDGTERHGGFLASAGTELNPDAVKQLRDKQ
ncbi:MAG TPA: hypothetical protein VHE35_03125 [Kofleriaceae bacterium]|nr:hypothetical protein [Kofleriaceae bacterium]